MKQKIKHLLNELTDGLAEGSQPILIKLLFAFLVVSIFPFVFYFPAKLIDDWLETNFGINVHILMLGVGITGSVVMSLLFARLIMNPLHVLEKTAREILSGAGKQLQVDASDEIGQLARSFDLLLTELKRRMGEGGIRKEVSLPCGKNGRGPDCSRRR